MKAITSSPPRLAIQVGSAIWDVSSAVGGRGVQSERGGGVMRVWALPWKDGSGGAGNACAAATLSDGSDWEYGGGGGALDVDHDWRGWSLLEDEGGGRYGGKDGELDAAYDPGEID